jgi:hypothetical protein
MASILGLVAGAASNDFKPQLEDMKGYIKAKAEKR